MVTATRTLGEASLASLVQRIRRVHITWLAIIAGTIALGVYGREGTFAPLVSYPEHWIIPLEDVISRFMDWLVHDLSFGLFTFHQLTRWIAKVLSLPLDFLQALLSTGTKFTPGGTTVNVPPVSWIGGTIAVVLIGLRYGGRRLAILLGASAVYLVVFGQLVSAMDTLASILVSVPLGVAGGLWLGISAYRSPAVSRVVTPALDFMQTVPIFAYLVPILVLFGFGPISAMIGTVVYAMPPMVRVTILALERVPYEIVEYSHMAGCSPRQRMWKVLLPAAKPTLMVGVNQVIMLSLNMVIIASMIGAGGLGHDVLAALHNLAIGQGAAAGIAITVIAIALDQLSNAVVQSETLEVQRPRWYRDRYLAGAVGAVVIFTIVSAAVPALAHYPEAWRISFNEPVNNAVTWVNVHWGAALYQLKAVLLIHVLVPLKRFMLTIPWFGVVAGLGLLAYQMGRWKVAVPVIGWGIFLAITGYWSEAIIAVYLCGVSVIVCCLVGIPLGMLTGLKPNVERVLKPVLDLLQTLPSFVYLIPVVMLFQVGSFAGMIAIVLYAIVPAVRYTAHGIRSVPEEVLEASRMSGCSGWQMLWKVRMPLALPEIMLGVNQTVMMALSMLVITALIGTTGLGQQVYIALTKADTGMGLVAGTCVAAIAIVTDRIIGAWARRRKEELGLA